MAISTAAHGVEIGRRALQAQQAAINTTGHNIANANTPGFSRRQVNLENAVSAVHGSIGSGADVASVVRARNQFVDAQSRVQQQVLGHWEALERALGGIEALFNETAGAGSSEAGTVFNESSGAGLTGSLSRFWNAWQDLGNTPESGAARAAVRQEGEYLATTMNQLYAQLVETRAQLDEEVQGLVVQVNDLVDRLGDVNAEIAVASFEEGAADLADQRDRLLDELSSLVDVSVLERANGQVTVRLAGHTLLEGDHVVHLRVRQLSQNGITTSTVAYADDDSPAIISEGQLRGLTEVRDEVVPDLLDRLDEMAASMVEEVNSLHRSGFGREDRKSVV